jgi:hypothetical protein
MKFAATFRSVTTMPKRMKLFAVPVFVLLVAGGFWLAPSPDAATTFPEGLYSLPFNDMAGCDYDFHSGRFQRDFFTDVGDPSPPDCGSYQLTGSALHLTFDDPKEPSATFHYRNVGGVAVLLNGKAAAIFDDQHLLVEYTNGIRDVAEYYVRDGRPKSSRYLSSRLRPASLMRDHPGFAAALPPATRNYYATSWTQYQRMRLRELPFAHPNLCRFVPSWLTNL